MTAEDQDLSKHDRLFSTEHLRGNLKQRSVRGGAITLVSQFLKLAITLGSLAILARILTIDEFGLMAMVAVVTGFVMLFKDIGLSAATVQREQISHEQVSTLFWVNIAASLVLAILTIATAPLLAWFFGRSELTWMTICLGSVFFLSGVSTQHQALLQRQMRFGTVVAIELGSMILAAVAAIAAAIAGWGYWALVLQQVVVVTVNSILTLGFVRWCPGLPVRGCGVRSMIAFGRNLSAFRALNYFSRNMDNFLIGWYWGAQNLGLYSKAYSLLLLPIMQVNMPIHAVAVPTLSRLSTDPPRFRRYVMRELNAMMWLTCPMIAIFIALAEDVIRIALGPQWLESVTVYRVLGISAFFQVPYTITDQIFISLNQTDRQFRWALIAMPLFVASFLIGLPFGIIGVATCYSTMFLLMLPWTFSYTLRHSPLSRRDLLQSMLVPIVVGVCVLILVWGVSASMSDDSALVRIPACLTLAGVTVLFSYLVSSSVRSEVQSLVGLVMGMRRGGNRVS